MQIFLQSNYKSDLLVRKIDCDSVGINNFRVDQNVSLLSVKIGPLKFGNVSPPNREKHEPFIRIQSDSSRLRQSDRKNRFADQIRRVVLLAAEHDDLAGVVEEVPVHGGPVDGDLVGRVEREHVRLRKSPAVDQVVDVGAEQVGFRLGWSCFNFN